MTPTTIVWFDRDLRVSDHEPLLAASRRGRVVPVFVWCPEDEGEHAPGAAYRWFAHHALASLDSSLRALGAPLVVRRGDAADTICALSAETGADAVFAHRRYMPALAARDEALVPKLAAHGVRFERFDGWLLHDPSSLRTRTGTPFRVFTPMWRASSESLAPAVPAPAPPRIEAVPGVASEPLDALGLLPRIRWDQGLAQAWTPSESAAREALERFAASRVDAYPVDRDRPDLLGTSRMSPYLAHGVVSPRQVWHAVAARTDAPFERGPGAAEYLRELMWREFAWHVLVNFPDTLDAPMQPRFAAFPWRDDPAGARAWQRGLTGYPLVDAGMRELWHTGWMHNRVRMVAASFLTKHLLVHWREGARWFQDTLVDVDLANNTLGWQWVAGSGADAAPYFRVLNPIAQAARFDPEGTYRERWLPSVRSGHPEPFAAPITAPIVEHGYARRRALEAYATL